MYATYNSYLVFFFPSNKLSSVCSPLCLKELKVLNISKNAVSFLAENFLKDCLKLETLNAGMNSLGECMKWRNIMAVRHGSK